MQFWNSLHRLDWPQTCNPASVLPSIRINVHDFQTVPAAYGWVLFSFDPLNGLCACTTDDISTRVHQE